MFLCWLVEGLSYRHTIVPDGVSYFDIASACAKGNWAAAINAYWSPAYPVLLSFVFSLFRPSPPRELLVVHCFNCFILILALCFFEYFLNGLEAYLAIAKSTEPETAPLPAWTLRAILYSLFFWASLFMTPPSLDTPDALVFALVILAFGIIVRIAAGSAGWLHFAALGVVLGLAYLAKAAMFPLAFVFLGVALLAVRNFRRAIPRLTVGLIFFLLIAGPFVLLLSKSKGRFTFNDTGAIAYAEYIDGVKPTVHWQGGPAGSGTPKHPTRKIFEMPPVYEFAGPVGGTYPPWFDPSYWYDGVRPHFRLMPQLNTLRHSFDAFIDLFSRLGGLFAGFFVLLLCDRRPDGFAINFLGEYFLWLPPVTCLGLYSLVLLEPRYISGFVIVLTAALFSALRVPLSTSVRPIVRAVALAVVLLLGLQIAWSVGHSILRLAALGGSPDWAVAQKLHAEGIEPGGEVAFIGTAAFDNYWARLAGVRVVAEIPNEGVSNYWAASPEVKSKVLSLLKQTGAAIVIARDLPPTLPADGWLQVPGTGYYLLPLKTSPSIESDGAFR